jgi:hypothetical protein
MEQNKIEQIRNRKLAIHAEIRFAPEIQKQLDGIMKEVSKDGDTQFLSKRDRFFSYCNERNVWYGSEHNTWLPYCSINELVV